MYLGECGNDHAEGSKGLVNGRAFLEPGTCTQPQRPQQPRTDKPTTQEEESKEESRGKGPREGTSRAVDQERPRHSVETETQRRETERERERERGKE